MGRRTKREIKRTEMLALRIDPKLRYLAELAARQQRRNLSGFTEWAIETAIKQVEVDGSNKKLGELGDLLWDVDEADRLVRLACYCRHLLTHEEQMIWKLILENDYFWKMRQEWREREDSDTGEILKTLLPVRTIGPDYIYWNRLRAEWPTLQAVARGEASPDTIPTAPPLPRNGVIEQGQKTKKKSGR